MQSDLPSGAVVQQLPTHAQGLGPPRVSPAGEAGRDLGRHARARRRSCGKWLRCDTCGRCTRFFAPARPSARSASALATPRRGERRPPKVHCVHRVHLFMQDDIMSAGPSLAKRGLRLYAPRPFRLYMASFCQSQRQSVYSQTVILAHP